MALQTGHDELKKAAKDMMDGNANLMNELKQIDSIVDGIVGSGWAGQASGAFQQLMARFSQDSKNLNDNLVQIAEAVSGSADLYQQQEEEAAKNVSAITDALG